MYHPFIKLLQIVKNYKDCNSYEKKDERWEERDGQKD